MVYLVTDYGVVLTEVTLGSEHPLSIRQMTAVLLRQYVDAHWSSLSDKFAPPEVNPRAKETIRRMLPEGLKESISKVGIETDRYSSRNYLNSRHFNAPLNQCRLSRRSSTTYHNTA